MTAPRPPPPPTLRAGDIVSFSAGSSAVLPLRYRSIRPAQDKLLSAAAVFPELQESLRGTHPLIINAYPAALGLFPDAATCDTYLRPINFTRALVLAAEQAVPALVMAQPLAALHLVRMHAASGHATPPTLELALGGYYCPTGVERELRAVLEARGCRARVYHAYGAAEADVACLLGRREPDSPLIVYYPLAASHRAQVRDGRLWLCASECPDVDTGDRATIRPDLGMVIENAPDRLAPRVRVHLDAWASSDWRRRTGYLRVSPEGIMAQLRVGETPIRPGELEFHDFARATGMTWMEKPQWGDQAEATLQASVSPAR